MEKRYFGGITAALETLRKTAYRTNYKLLLHTPISAEEKINDNDVRMMRSIKMTMRINMSMRTGITMVTRTAMR